MKIWDKGHEKLEQMSVVSTDIPQENCKSAESIHDADCSEYKIVDSFQIKSNIVVILDNTDIMPWMQGKLKISLLKIKLKRI